MLELLLNNLKTLLWIVTAIYALCSLGFYMRQEYNDSIVFGGYAVANLGALKVVQIGGI